MKGKQKFEKIKDYKVPDRKQPFYSFVKWILRLFIKAKVELHCDTLPEKAIVVTNHAGKMGPLVLDLYYPHFNVKWGAHQMLGGYCSRFSYLRNVLYIQKLGLKKFPATVKALFEALFSKMLYRGMKVIPTYTDERFLYTVRSSIQVLDADASLMIFPEDSAKGYFDELTAAFAGFVALAEQYYNRTGQDVPVVPAYYHAASKRILVYPSVSVQALKKEGLNRYQIADAIKERINDIYRDHFKENT